MSDEFPLGETVMVAEEDYNELLNDVEYWHMTAMMLSAKLTEFSIDHEVSETALETYIKENAGDLQ